jgi:hypothetical protein
MAVAVITGANKEFIPPVVACKGECSRMSDDLWNVNRLGK